jgi:hypothetical protein
MIQEPTCPDCTGPLQIIMEFDGNLWRCLKCRIEYDLNDLHESDDFSGDPEDINDIW